LIKEHATKLGFSGIAIAKAEFMEPEARKLEEWLNLGLHGEMSFMTKHFDLRTDPTKLIPNAKSVICLLYNYYTENKQMDADAPKISMYAHGRDYHKVVYKRMKKLLKYMKSIAGDIGGRCFVDSGPVMERDWARRSGLGWTGKNTLLIHPTKGSYFFLGEIICDLELEYDLPIKDFCGTCTRCIEACPTEAISPEGYLVDASKCISYLTIELKDEIPKEFASKMDNWMYGCDICQQVCPWNKFSQLHDEADFMAPPELLYMSKKEWKELNEETFEVIFKGSPVKRAQYDGLKRNIGFLKG
jgi:epoxyqueuosine reductase